MIQDSTYKRLLKLPLPDKAKITNKLSVGLVVPPSNYALPKGWEWTHTAPFEGPSIIASLVKGLGYRFKLLDQRDNPSVRDLKGKTTKFDIVGIATYEDNFPYIKKATELIRKENKKSIIVLGGPLVTSCAKVMMENTKADFAVVGEGELTFTELLDYISKNNYAKKLEDIDGLAWKDEKGIFHMNKTRTQMEQLDAVPFQDFSVWDRFKGKTIPEVYLSYSRGCIGNCAFCYRPMPLLRYKSIKRVTKEIRFLKKYKFKMAWWNDLTFPTDKKYVRKLINAVFKIHRFRWNCFSRVTTVDLPLLRHMKKNGCDIILYGFESISQSILNSYRKGITKDAILNAIALTRKAGIKCGGLFIVGAPEETKESIENVIAFTREFKEATRAKYLSLLPGTPLYVQAMKDGIIKDEVKHLNWLAREQSIEEDIEDPGFVFVAKHITKKQLRYAYHEVNKIVEERPYDYTNEKNVFLDTPIKLTRFFPRNKN